MREGTYGLVEGAVPVVRRDTVLLQEVLLQEPRDVEADLVRLAERALADELHNLGELVLLLEDLLRDVPVVQEVRLGLLVVRLQNSSATRRAARRELVSKPTSQRKPERMWAY